MDVRSYFHLDSDREDQEYRYREVLVNVMLIFSILTLSVFAIIHFYKGDLLLPAIQVLLVSAYAFAYLDPLKTLSKRFKENLVISGTVVLFLFLLVDGGVTRTGIYWVPFFPFMAFAVSGLRRGWRWIAVFTFGVLSIQVFDYLGVLNTPYSFEEMFFFMLSFMVYVILAALFEGLHIRQQNELEAQNDSLVEMREKLKGMLSGLEQEVETRTLELKLSNQQLAQEIENHKLTNQNLKETEQKFYQAQKMEALGTLVGGIAHDFNSILSGINANLFLVQRQIKDKPQVQGLLDEIEKMSFHAAAMTKQLLTFARKDNVEKLQFDMRLFMDESIKLATASLPSRIKLRTHLSKDNLSIAGNVSQLQQVMMNLINNARDALSNTEVPVITIRMSSLADAKGARKKHPDLEGGEWIYLAVSDNGIGISSKDLPHIFEPFFTTKVIGKGTGLGLAMCYGAVQSHGGRIEVESQLNQGCAFHIYLPIEQVPGLKGLQQSISETLHGKGETILIVDDDEGLCVAHQNALETLGYKVLLARNGFEAIKVYANPKANIDLVVMDIMMPEMDGIKAAKHILMMDEQANIIFASGYELDSSTERFLSEGFEEVDAIRRLKKPFTIEQLCKTIRRELD